MEETTINKRVARLIEALDISQNVFAKALSTSSSRVSNIVTGRNKPDSDFLAEVLRVFRSVNPMWLMTGEGNVFGSSDTLKSASTQNPNATSDTNSTNPATPIAQVNAQVNAQVIPKDKMNRVPEPVHLTPSTPTDARRLAEHFDVRELATSHESPWGNGTDIIVATQDTEGNPTFSLINYKAAANYLTGYQSQEYYSDLAPISLPRQLVGNPRQGIVLQIEGDSMTPRFQHGDYVAAILLDRSEWGQIRDLDCYVVVSHSHGIQFKRIKSRLKQFGFVRCKSDNRRHTPYNIEEEDLIQLFRFVLHISPDASNTDETLFNKVESIEERVEDQRDMYEQLSQRMEDMQRLLQQQLPPTTK
ncbi:XRE family transcriptional regulator [Hymenobacter rubripertinctus]|uniref:XRE family transcriptional regulator n=1 Tax=Hymenobacter rubripertinctus TaxID=2029981 RepID=UPI00160151BD|nr:S24 family peptidase [Hymenobacter rubripertinctus]